MPYDPMTRIHEFQMRLDPFSKFPVAVYKAVYSQPNSPDT